VLNDTHLQHFETSTEDTFVCHMPYHSALEYATKMHQLAGMLSPRPGLGLKAQKNWPRPYDYWPRPCDYWPRPPDSCGLMASQFL